MSRLVKFSWYISLLLFLIVLLWVYAYFPSNVGVHADSRGVTDYYVGREYLFYLLLGIFFLPNIAFYALYKLLYLQYLQRINLNDPSAKRVLKQDLADWLLAFAATLNIFLILGMVYLAVFNNSGGVTLSHYGPIVYAGPVLMGIMLIILFIIFIKKRP